MPLLMIALFTSLLAFVAPPATQESPWTVWLYDRSSAEVTEFDPMGHPLQTWMLPGMGKFELIPPDLFVSPSGRFAIYGGRETRDAPYQLVIYDAEAGRIRHTFSLIPSGDLGGGQVELFNVWFDETAGQAALAYYAAFYYAETANNANWEIRILDLDSGSMESVLTAPPDIARSFDGQQVYSIPVLQYFAAGVAEFTVMAGGTENWPDSPLFAWDLAADTVQSIEHYTAMANKVWLPTGDMIFPAQDDRFGPLQECAGPGAPHMLFNVIAVYDRAAGDSFPFFQQEGYAPLGATFVQNGERLLIETCGTVNVEHRLTLVERDGTIVNHFVMPPGMGEIRSTPDGFVYLAVADATLYGANNQVLIPVLMHIRTDDNTFRQTMLWRGQQETIYALQLAHVASIVPLPESYRPWQKLTPAGSD